MVGAGGGVVGWGVRGEREDRQVCVGGGGGRGRQQAGGWVGGQSGRLRAWEGEEALCDLSALPSGQWARGRGGGRGLPTPSRLLLLRGRHGRCCCLVVQELCNRCLARNRSCARAWELLGAVAEKGGSPLEAARHYEAAWQLGSRSDPQVTGTTAPSAAAAARQGPTPPLPAGCAAAAAACAGVCCSPPALQPPPSAPFAEHKQHPGWSRVLRASAGCINETPPPASAQVGYKLGLNYLKAAKPVEAVTTACMVLSMYPAYPRVRKDVLEKARLAIRA